MIKKPFWKNTQTFKIDINGKTFELKDGRSVTWNMIPYDVQLI